MDFSLFASAPYAILAVVCSLLTGLGIGYLIWGFQEDDEEDAVSRVRTRVRGSANADALTRLEEEIRAAKTTLAGIAQEKQDFSKDIDELDTAIKRANGRLTVMLGAQNS